LYGKNLIKHHLIKKFTKDLKIFLTSQKIIARYRSENYFV